MCLEGICLLCLMMCVCAHPCIPANAFNQNCQLNGSMARSRREFTLNQVALLHISVPIQLNHLPILLMFPMSVILLVSNNFDFGVRALVVVLVVRFVDVLPCAYISGI